jgi:phosphoglycolate phosphatase-like HAD superfamily hydrolase
MNHTGIHILDFDGVICDSAIETGISGWKAASKIWPDMPAEMPNPNLLEDFRHVRPILETGYEAILIIRLLSLGETVAAIMGNYANKTQSLLSESNKDVKFLKELFGATRDQWINEDLADWINKNPLFPGVAEKLHQLQTQNPWYIVTTKQERFVKQILSKNQIELADERIYGLERNLSKEAMLLQIMEKHPDQHFTLLEDRLPTLWDVARNEKLQQVKLFLAAWGYNTPEEKQGLESGPIKLLSLHNFLVSF